MWNWDQGHLAYFQYEALRRVARFVTGGQWRQDDDGSVIREATGLPFAAPETHGPWRNYIRVYKLCLLVGVRDGVAVPTRIAELLAQAGAVTCDEYLHFLARATTDPSPALEGWEAGAADPGAIRHPLCFALRYLLARAAVAEPITPMYEVIGAYAASGFSGAEAEDQLLALTAAGEGHEQAGRDGDSRQARESLRVLSQLSYLHGHGGDIVVSLGQEDARTVLESLTPVSGPHELDGDAEIHRLANLFGDGAAQAPFAQPPLAPHELESGFAEGGRVVRHHTVTERNPRLRTLFFRENSTAVCDACRMDTRQKYPWTERVLDLHHILPLSSGIRADSGGTVLDDLVPVCPSCHRAIHRFYDDYLRSCARPDFLDAEEARGVYEDAKEATAEGDCLVG